MARTGPLLLATIAVSIFGHVHSAEYYGKFLGKLSELHHGVSGEVYAVDGRTLHIRDFTYDGEGPTAYFYASTFKSADGRGFRLRDENNNGEVIRRYRKEHVTLTLPEGKNLNNIKIFYVWCEEYEVNFGDVKIPRNFDFPRPQKIEALKGVHSISSDNIVIVDAQTLLIPNLHYDGEAPDAKFWVGRGSKPSPQGIRVMDENGKELPLRRYDGKTIVLTLPGDLTVFDIGHFGIWCEEFTVDFGHIQIPQQLNIPPSLKMLGVSPQKRHQLLSDNSREVTVRRPQIGGHLQATTFRPPSGFFHAQRRQEFLPQQNDFQQGYVPFQQYQPFHQQPAQERSFNSGYQQQQHSLAQQQQLLQQQQQLRQQQQQQWQYQQHSHQQPQFVHQPRQIIVPQQLPQQYVQQTVGHYQSQNIPPVSYQPLNQRQYQGPNAYNKQQEQQQFVAQFAKPRNRFDLQHLPSQNQQAYVPFG